MAEFELIDGEILPKMPQNETHVRMVVLLMRALVAVFGWDFVRSQAPVAIGPYDEPEPDGAVTVQPASVYLASDTPSADQIRLVVEISDSTLAYDRHEKAILYATAGIPEYWVIDPTGRRLLVHRKPRPDGYGALETLTESECVFPLAASGRSLAVSDLLP